MTGVAKDDKESKVKWGKAKQVESKMLSVESSSMGSLDRIYAFM